MYRRLLVPLDYTGCAHEVARHAAQIAGAFGASVTLLHVIPDPTGARGTRAIEDEALTELQALRSLFPEGVEVRIDLRPGEPAEAICAALAQDGADLVVMGSVAEHVIRAAHVPVLVIRGPGEVRDATSAASDQMIAETHG
jgi:nucleotide-binding universal stress UspA family protein